VSEHPESGPLQHVPAEQGLVDRMAPSDGDGLLVIPAADAASVLMNGTGGQRGHRLS
jgi:hypothetical protein